MSIASNLYAEKVFAQHPTVLWSLDDKADYVSQISEAQRGLSFWEPNNGEASLFITEDAPFASSIVTKITANQSPMNVKSVTRYVSNDIKNFKDLDQSLKTMAIGTYFKSFSQNASRFSIGYEYNDEASGTIITKLKSFETSITDSWMFIGDTFRIPEDDVSMRLVFEIDYFGDADNSEIEVLLNGFSFGQWCEEFHSESLGSSIVTIPTTISTTITKGIEAFAYSRSDQKGYYLLNGLMNLKAKNFGVPIVYGSQNSTQIYYNDGSPSLILPANGFLNQSGKNNQYTLEFWANVNSKTYDRKRIVGPLNSQDGIYVDGNFVGIKIGSNYQTHYVAEWGRPMLFDFFVNKTRATLSLNGEKVIDIQLTENSYIPQNKLDSNGKDQDWIGFYAYTDIPNISIDCVGLYPYEISDQLAKIRFVYGQGVEFPENINTAYSGSSVYIDYAFANYANNYSYPSLGTWSQGVGNNVSISNNKLTVPEYPLPEIVLSSKTEANLFASCLSEQNESENFITFRPTEDWALENGYLRYNSLSFLNDEVSILYGVFKAKEEQGTQCLIRISDDISGNYFSIDLVGLTLRYKLVYGGQEEILYTSPRSILVNDVFSAGIDIRTLSNYYAQNVSSFFGNIGSLSVYVGGTKLLTNTFTGNIYAIGFCNARNSLKVKHLFNETGLPIDYEDVFGTFPLSVELDAGDKYFGSQSAYFDYINDGGNASSFANDSLLTHMASCTLLPKQDFNSFRLGIDVNAYWEDSIPLSNLATYVKDARGDEYYNLDFIQFNLDYDSPQKLKESDTSAGSWKYGETIYIDGTTKTIPSLYEKYSVPTSQKYSSLDNHLYTGYDDYDDLKNNSVKTYTYDTTDSIVKSYVSFKFSSSSYNQPDLFFENTQSIAKDGIIYPGTNWINTKYEVINNSIIYPPKSSSVNDISIVTHIDFFIKDSKVKKPMIKFLQYSSQALNDTSPNPVGTRFGIPMYPYTKTGSYYDYKSNNPFSIYKGSSPYLYLTKRSGIELRGQNNPNINRGISIPLNQTKSIDYNLMVLQACIKYSDDTFPFSEVEIFEIKASNKHIKFYLVANNPDGNRAKIYAINAKTGALENGVGFYLNGTLVSNPVISIDEWAFLGISFPELLYFYGTPGYLHINGPLMMNTISYYQSTNLQEVQKTNKRLWFRVRYSPEGEYPWTFWYPALWNGVLVLSSKSYYGVDPSDIYKSYVGTNKVIIDSESTFTLKDYDYFIATDVGWTAQTLSAI